MKSWLELVSWCGPPVASGPEVSEGEEMEDQPSKWEETSSLARRSRRRRRRMRAGTLTSSSSAPEAMGEWKPSLCSISEDNVVAEDREKAFKEAKAAERVVVRRKSGGASRSRVHVRSYSEDFWQNQVQTVIPAFSPTPFMF